MAKVLGACEECGKTIEYWPSQKRRFCSRSCRGRFQGRAQSGQPEWHRPTKPRRGQTRPCEVCGTPVYYVASEAARGQKRFCSRACFNAAQTKTPVIKMCAGCGKELRLKPSQAARQFCSKQCEALSKITPVPGRVHNGRPARYVQDGYVLLWEPTHPSKTYKGWVPEHRLVVEREIGRYLAPDEHIHHRNGIKDDNRLENLEVMDAIEHAALSVSDYRDQVQRDLDELAEYRKRFGALS